MSQLQSPAVDSSTYPTLTAEERDELVRLRREVGDLRAAGSRPRGKFRWRSLMAAVLIVLGCVLAPAAGVSVWVHNQVSDTDRFVATMGPLVDDPEVQSRLTDRLTATVFQYVDVKGIANDAVAALAAQGLPPRVTDRLSTLTPTLASAVTGFVHDKIAALVASPAFAKAWNQAIRAVHGQAVSVLSGNSQAVVVRGDTVFLDLAPFITLAKQRLSAAGLTAVNLVPDIHPSVALAKADTLVRAQSAYSTLDTVARVLPWIVLLLLAVGIYLARNRFRALVGAGLGLALSMVVLGAGLLVARSMLVGAVPPGAAPATASGFDIVIVETVGVGQDEIEVVRTVQTNLVVLVPGMGDDIQAIKAGIMEIADVFGVNKADRPGADRTVTEITMMMSLVEEHAEWVPPIVKTVASRREGIAELDEAAEQHFAYLNSSGELDRRNRERVHIRIETQLKERFMDRLIGGTMSRADYEALLEDVLRKRNNPHDAAEAMLGRVAF